VLVLAAGFCLIFRGQASAASGYMYRRSISIAPANLGAACASDVDNFALLVNLTNAEERSADCR